MIGGLGHRDRERSRGRCSSRRQRCKGAANRGVVQAGRDISVSRVRCPFCASVEDRVVDSRTADDGAAIRRRRECTACGRRFTTFERVDETGLVVRKRSGAREGFDRAKVVSGVMAATKNRPVSSEELESLATSVEDAMRLEGPEVTSQQVGVAVLERLKALDEVAYVRFASVYKGFEDLSDFEREMGLLSKSTLPKGKR